MEDCIPYKIIHSSSLFGFTFFFCSLMSVFPNVEYVLSNSIYAEVSHTWSLGKSNSRCLGRGLGDTERGRKCEEQEWEGEKERVDNWRKSTPLLFPLVSSEHSHRQNPSNKWDLLPAVKISSHIPPSGWASPWAEDTFSNPRNASAWTTWHLNQLFLMFSHKNISNHGGKTDCIGLAKKQFYIVLLWAI